MTASWIVEAFDESKDCTSRLSLSAEPVRKARQSLHPWRGRDSGAPGCIFTEEVNMTAEEFAEAIDKLIVAARESGLSDAKIIVVLEDAVEGLDEGLSA